MLPRQKFVEGGRNEDPAAFFSWCIPKSVDLALSDVWLSQIILDVSITINHQYKKFGIRKDDTLINRRKLAELRRLTLHLLTLVCRA